MDQCLKDTLFSRWSWESWQVLHRLHSDFLGSLQPLEGHLEAESDETYPVRAVLLKSPPLLCKCAFNDTIRLGCVAGRDSDEDAFTIGYSHRLVTNADISWPRAPGSRCWKGTDLVEEVFDDHNDPVRSCRLDERSDACLDFRSAFKWLANFQRVHAQYAFISAVLELEPRRAQVHWDLRNHGRPSLHFVFRWGHHCFVVLAPSLKCVHKPDRRVKKVANRLGAHLMTDLKGSQPLAECKTSLSLWCVFDHFDSSGTTTRYDVRVLDELLDFVPQLLRKPSDEALRHGVD